MKVFLNRFGVWGLAWLGLLVPIALNVGYQPFTLEVLATAAVALLAGAVCAWLIDPGSRVGALGLAVLIVAWLHIYFPLHFPDPMRLSVAFVAVLLVLYLARPFAAVASALALGASIAGAMLEAPASEQVLQERVVQGNTRPPVIHLLLDEHASDWGLPADIVTDSERAALWEPLVRRGFAVFDRGFSREGVSQRSFSAMVNPGVDPETALKLDGANWRFTRTSLLEQIARSRPLDVTGISFMDLAPALKLTGNVARHANQNIAVAPSNFGSFGVAVSDRLRFLFAGALNWLSRGQKVPAFQAAEARWQGYFKQFELQSRMYTVTSLSALDRIEARLTSTPGGRYVFAHLLLPHYPYSFRADCSIHSPSEWRSRVPEEGADTFETRRERYRLYLGQMQCLQTRLIGMLDRILALPAYRDAVVLLHGDHGSRIAFRDKQAWLNLGRSSAEFERDWRASFIAVRMPGSAGRRVETPTNISEVFHRLVATDFDSFDPGALQDWDPTLAD